MDSSHKFTLGSIIIFLSFAAIFIWLGRDWVAAVLFVMAVLSWAAAYSKPKASEGDLRRFADTLRETAKEKGKQP